MSVDMVGCNSIKVLEKTRQPVDGWRAWMDFGR